MKTIRLLPDAEESDMAYLHKEDCVIERDEDGSAGLWDCDGDFRHRFPASMSDEQILVAVAFANKAFDAGVSFGEESQAAKMRAALKI